MQHSAPFLVLISEHLSPNMKSCEANSTLFHLRHWVSLSLELIAGVEMQILALTSDFICDQFTNLAELKGDIKFDFQHQHQPSKPNLPNE